jgi:hypothetical protein
VKHSQPNQRVPAVLRLRELLKKEKKSMNLSKAEQFALTETCPLTDAPRDLEECAGCGYGIDEDEEVCLYGEDEDKLQSMRDREYNNLVAQDNIWREA